MVKNLKIEYCGSWVLRVSQHSPPPDYSLYVDQFITELQIENWIFYDVRVIRRNAALNMIYYEMNYLKRVRITNFIESTDEFLNWLKNE